ncbi:carbohydrate ABC transporter permease [Alicyclobacillus fastidiosus]|uniref:Carbohydrate ABC transporter permease n=1 Tax=Alicyclobacillus fastidiosus TaxID=392011 RepID=A0ABY6ZAU7_9BACL|nr:carbohydrate ABC transporter permease [Alicyclobacillus fastidiosus]WAH39865.1 carbohydrate ABC transporter permease [Alicyclobacillus fastidiosus]GMA61130.1 sugar ABC transporter ATP-binding protein [Alicyclobacillus fastidiosus]
MDEAITVGKHRRKVKLQPVDLARLLALLVFGFLMISPFILILSISFDRTANVTLPYPPRFLPAHPSLFNYRLIFQNGGLLQAYVNSFIVAVASVIVKVSSALLAGYAFSKGKFKGKRVIFLVFLATLMVPVESRLISLYLMWNHVHLINTFWPLILPNMIDAFLVFLAKQFFDELPDSFREAAQIDGAGEFRTFLKVYLPLAGPITATMAILSFMWSWNDFLWPLIVLTSTKLHTIPLYMASFTLQNGESYAGMTMAALALGSIPVLILFIFLQKYVIRSVALSGLKGE